MRFRTLTGLQRHKVTNALFVAGVVSAIGTVSGSQLLGCPAIPREKHLDNEAAAEETDVDGPKDLKEARFVAGKLHQPTTENMEVTNAKQQ